MTLMTISEELRLFDENEGQEQSKQMDKEEQQASQQWRNEEINTRIRRKDNTIEQGD